MSANEREAEEKIEEEVDAPQSRRPALNLPPWVRKTFLDHGDHLDEINDLMELAGKGISMLPRVPQAIEALSRGGGEPSSVSLAESRVVAGKATRELDRGLPMLHSQGAIALWSGLECYVKRIVEEFLTQVPGALDSEPIRKIKIPLAEFQSMTDPQRIAYLLETLERDLRVADGSGVGGFERLLGVFGLSGSVDPIVRSSLFELNKVRNVFAHRRGRADERLVRALPGRGYEVGAPILLAHCCFFAFYEAVSAYSFELLLRLVERFGHTREEFVAEMRASAAPWPPPIKAHKHGETPLQTVTEQ